MLRATFVLVGALVVLATSSSADAASRTGVVIAKNPSRGTLLLAGGGGVAATVKASLLRVDLGDRVALSGVVSRRGTLRASSLRVNGHARRATFRGVVLRELADRTVLAAAGSVVSVRHNGRSRLLSASGNRRARLHPGDVAQVEIEFRRGVATRTGVVVVGQADTVEVEGRVLSISPLVISVGGLPVTITLPSGAALPAGIVVGTEIELTVRVDGGNVFTFVSVERVNDEEVEDDVDEVEVEGIVFSSSPGSIIVTARGVGTFTFAAPAGTTLATLPVGTRVEVKGRRVNGVLTIVRLKVEANSGGDDDHGHGGGDDHGDGGSSGHGGGDGD